MFFIHYSLLFLSLLLVTTTQNVPNCNDVNTSNQYVCRIYPGQCGLNVTTIEECPGDCYDDSFCCPTDWVLCGAGFSTISYCYNPSYYTCCGLDSSPGGTAPVLCDSPTRADRTNACIRPTGQLPGCAPISGPQISTQPQKTCNGLSYSNETYVCVGNVLLCPIQQFLGCNSFCFSPSVYVCIGEIEFNQSLHDINGQSAFLTEIWVLCPLSAPYRCGNACYNPDQYVCYSQNLAFLTQDFLCPLSAPYLCGSSCYNDNDYCCQDGQLVSVS